MLAELLATEGVEEVCELRSPDGAKRPHGKIGFMAFHGGSLEAVTDAVAEAAAERAGVSFYAIRQPWGFRWHIPSSRLDPAESAAMTAFLEHIDVAVAIHGWGTDGMTQDPTPSARYEPNPWRFGRDGKDRPILLGGGNRRLARHLGAALRAALPSYEIVDDIDEIPRRVRGLDPRNPVNRPRDAGVQLELTPRVRGLPPFWPKEQRGTRCPDTQALIGALAEAVGTLP